MKILLVNKFLYPKGGAENYVFKLGKILESNNHQVEYFGLENPKNIVGNSANAYVSDIDFAKGVKGNLSAPFKIIYSAQARKKIRRVLDDFKPDVVHFNNIQFHLTPSMLLEINKYNKQTHSDVKIVYTAHDYQLICPSHGLFDTNINICEKCIGGNYTHCLKTKCHKNSYAKSFLAMADAYFWKLSKAYSYIDTIICPSQFLKSKLDTDKRFAHKTVAIHNFVDEIHHQPTQKGDYVLEFGHLSKDKGTLTLLDVAKNMPNTKFVFAGYGKAVEEIEKVPNAKYVGFKTGDELTRLISQAQISVYPSMWYENCPFSVIESQLLQTPVVASRMGGIPELVQEGKTGELFEAGNAKDLENKIRHLIENPDLLAQYNENCKKLNIITADDYYKKLMEVYQ